MPERGQAGCKLCHSSKSRFRRAVKSSLQFFSRLCPAGLNDEVVLIARKP